MKFKAFVIVSVALVLFLSLAFEASSSTEEVATHEIRGDEVKESKQRGGHCHHSYCCGSHDRHGHCKRYCCHAENEMEPEHNLGGAYGSGGQGGGKGGGGYGGGGQGGGKGGGGYGGGGKGGGYGGGKGGGGKGGGDMESKVKGEVKN